MKRKSKKDFERRYNYVKTLRAQLSNHEQLLLYYNALTNFGYPWLNDKEKNPNSVDLADGYLLKYKMIKNIQLPLADLGKRPDERFAKERENMKLAGRGELFEWHEIEKRI